MDNVLSVAFCYIGTGIHIGRRQYTDVCRCFLPFCVYGSNFIPCEIARWICVSYGEIPLGIQNETFKDTSVAVRQKQMKGL